MRPLSAVLAVLWLAPLSSARAEDQVFPCSLVMDPNDGPISDPRLEHLIVSGVHVNVLLPPGYRAHGERRYPVLYLFHGAFGDEDSWTTQTDLIAYTASLPEGRQVIAVMPDGGHLPAGRDWVDGSNPQESFIIGTLIPFVESHFRARAGRASRGLAGFSGGGLDAMILAERHPELFSAAGAFSGFLDPYSPDGIGIVQEFASLDSQLCGASYAWTSIWGDPVAHPMGWIGHDPIDLAGNLSSTAVYVSAGNGTPCAGDPDDPTLEGIEMLVLGMAQEMDGALSAAGVAHTMEYKSCGIHQFGNSNADLRRFWPILFGAFGEEAPRQFDFATGDAQSSAWDWTFTADPARAPELATISGASRRGLQITGSGLETIRTAPLFERGDRVCVSGSGAARAARADSTGRLSFSVDLGAPHSLEQGTPEELSAAAAPGYFTTRTIRFSSCEDDR